MLVITKHLICYIILLMVKLNLTGKSLGIGVKSDREIVTVKICTLCNKKVTRLYSVTIDKKEHHICKECKEK